MNKELYILSYLDNVGLVAEKLKDQCPNILRAIDILFETWQENGHVFLMGNGGSASTASHFAADLAKTINDRSGGRALHATSLVDNVALTSAMINDRGWNDLYVGQLSTYYPENLSTRIVGIGISVHGGSGYDHAGLWSQNILRGLQYIKDRGGRTIGISGFDGGAMKLMADISIVVPAESTPLVESFHVVLHHLIAFGLKELIEESFGLHAKGCKA